MRKFLVFLCLLSTVVSVQAEDSLPTLSFAFSVPSPQMPGSNYVKAGPASVSDRQTWDVQYECFRPDGSRRSISSWEYDYYAQIILWLSDSPGTYRVVARAKSLNDPNMPVLVSEKNFVILGPLCANGEKDGDEIGIDCGGSCGACPETCDDNILNQGEERADCGGPCSPCPTLNLMGESIDGVRDDMETEGRSGIIVGLEIY